MIEKRFPRKLNKSVDSRILGADSMSDALNINVSENTEGEGGNGGVIKPVKSNVPLDQGFTEFGDSEKVVVGKVLCNKYDIAYFFVYEANGDGGVYAYDPTGYLPNSEGGNAIVKIFSHPVLQFDYNGFVKADITYIQRKSVVAGKDYIDVPYIFFTDNKSEPKKLNVLRAIVGDYNDDEIEDFILACPKTPVNRIVPSSDSEAGGFENETEFDQNEFLEIEGFQFAYQNVYKDGFESAISAYSKIFVPPGYLQYSGQSDISLLNSYNAIDLVIPNDDMSSEVERVKLLARRGNKGSFFLIKELLYEGEEIEYRFLNDSVNSALDKDTQSKPFDNLPKRAEAQTIIDNRLVYGNYVDGFDNVDLSSTISPIVSERPEDFKSFEIEVLPSVAPSESDYSGSGAQNKNIGFTLDCSGLEGPVDAGSFISFSFTVNPKQNFHVYDATNSYHQSPQMGEDFDNDGYDASGIGTIPDYTGSPALVDDESDLTGHPKGYWWQSAEKSGASFIRSQFGANGAVPAVCSNGVNIDEDVIKFRWRYFDMFAGTSDISDVEQVDFGTSAANPLILQGRAFTIRCSFTAKTQLSKAQVAEVFSMILEGGEDPSLSTYAEDIVFPTEAELSYDINLGLNNGSSAKETSGIANLITTAGKRMSFPTIQAGGGISGEDAGPSEDVADFVNRTDEASQDPSIVKGFFVVNKATVKFGLFRDKGYNEEVTAATGQHPDSVGSPAQIVEDNGNPRARFGIYVKEVSLPDEENAILSCMRRPVQGARWWFFAPYNLEEGDTSPLLPGVDFREYSLFPFNSPDDGSPQGGLQVNPGFAAALGHNVDNDATPQDSIGTTQGIRVSIPGTGEIISITEENMFRQVEGSSFFAPWKTVLGGLHYTSEYVDAVTNRGESVVFFKGESPEGKSSYTLMDGAGGPGGGGIDENSVYDTYALHGLLGPNLDDYGVGIGSVGSVGLFGISRSDQDGGDLVFPGLYGPGIDNNIVLGLDASSDAKFPAVQHSGDDFLTGDNNYEIDNPTLRQTSLPFIHLGTGNFITVDPSIGQTFVQAFLRIDHFDEDFAFISNPNLFETQISNPDGVNNILFLIEPGSGGSQSFKAGANHAFGVVFYDERGRCSEVNPIGSMYVPWFGERDNNLTGPVESVSITPAGEIPNGATAFRFVYSGNTTMSRFVQYSSGGAFVTPGNADTDSGNIFVSLNHLQGHPISFSKAKGARSVEGAQDVYTYREGDRLRIISHFNTQNNRVFAGSEYEFNVVDQRFLNDGTDNPLYDVEQDGELPHPSKVGPFLVLENNPQATDFTADVIKLGENDPDSTTHAWNKRCVFEVYSPKKSADEESLVYYEIGPVYPIVDFGQEKTLKGGDIWFKTEAMNFQKVQDGNFVSLISENEATSNFFPYNIESQVFSTKVSSSDVWGQGKIKLVAPNTQESRKEASITFSDKNNPISKINTITSFNPVKGQFKDLPSEFGDINYLINNDDSIFVIQSNRCSSVPVNRNIITDGGGGESLVAAKSVMGTERYYAGNYGCDNNPESVCDIGNTVYFASKSKRQVYKFNPSSGIQVISEVGMKTFFKDLFEQAEADELEGMGEIKVVGGYDPYEDNYILSVYNQPTIIEEVVEEDDTSEEDDTTTVDDDATTVDDDTSGETGGDTTDTGDDTTEEDTSEDDVTDEDAGEDDSSGGGGGGGDVDSGLGGAGGLVLPDDPGDILDIITY